VLAVVLLSGCELGILGMLAFLTRPAVSALFRKPAGVVENHAPA
jgi:hypothetical protein